MTDCHPVRFRWLATFAFLLVGLAGLTQRLEAQDCSPQQFTCNDQPDETPPQLYGAVPGSGSTFSGTASSHPFALEVRWCDDGSINATTVGIWVDGTAITSTQERSTTYTGCASYVVNRGTVTLPPGTKSVVVKACDNMQRCSERTLQYTYQQQAPPDTTSPPAATSPTANVTFSPDNAPAGTVVQLRANASSSVTSYWWEYRPVGGGWIFFSTAASPTLSLGAPGLYELALIVSDAQGVNSPRYSTILTVGGVPPTSNLTFTPDQAPPGTTIQLRANASSGATWYWWNYRAVGGTWVHFSTAANPQLTLPSAGQYEVALLVGNAHGGQSQWDGATITVGKAPVVALESTLPLIRRDQCLTMALPGDVAYECGDLRLAHALPSITALNRARAPVLLYNSQHANPEPVVGTAVTLSASAGIPDQVEARLWVGRHGQSMAQWARRTWPGSQWVPGQTNRLGLAFTGFWEQTGLYDYRVEVVAWYQGVPHTTTASGQLVLVNRRLSVFGSGWHLAGLERLHSPAAGDSLLLWEGGDGSARLYRRSLRADGSKVWRADALERPDSIFWNAQASAYERRLPGGAGVRYAATGLHTVTFDRLNRQTRFTYDANGRLDALWVPLGVGPSAPALPYRFSYDAGSGMVRSISAPDLSGNPSRTVQVFPHHSAGPPYVGYIRDPDGHDVSFVYNTSGKLAGRWDRMGVFVAYAYGDGGRLSEAMHHMGPYQAYQYNGQEPVRLRFTPKETRGLVYGDWYVAALTPLDSAYTHLNGPRDDVTDAPGGRPDHTKLWLNGLGAPRKIVNALGDSTLIVRGDTRFPALVTRVDAPGANGSRRVSRAEYDALGRLVATVAENPLGDGRNASTIHAYDDASWPDFVTRTTTPERVVSTRGYDAAGNVAWQQVGPDPAGRVEFDYHPLTHTSAPGLPWRVRTQAAETRGEAGEVYAYDARGNLASVTGPNNVTTQYRRDGLGRDTLVIIPIGDGQSQTVRTVYDAAGRDTLTFSSAPGRTVTTMGGGTQEIRAEALRVRTSYDAEGRVRSVARRSEPDPTAIDWVTTRYDYDALGRKVAEFAPDTTPLNLLDNPADSTYYDPAGNVVRTVSRLGEAVRLKYDALNRLTERSVPAVTRQQNFINVPGGGTWSYPRYVADAHGAYETAGPQTAIAANVAMPGEEARFFYDAMGNLTRAENGDARIARSYHPNGLLRTDTLRIRTYGAQDFGTHAYGLEYRYDLSGRRTALVHPRQLVAGEHGYAYEPSTGALSQVTDPARATYGFTYDAEGRLSELRRGWSSQTYVYNAAGQLERRLEGGGAEPLHDDRYLYDARGKVSRVDFGTGSDAAFAINLYTGLGSLARTENTSALAVTPVPERLERYQNDALGNRVSSLVNIRAATDGVAGTLPDELVWRYQANTGRLLYVHKGGEPTTRDQQSTYDRAGNRTMFAINTGVWTPYPEDTGCVFFGTSCASSGDTSHRQLFDVNVQFYDAAGRLRLVDRRACLISSAGCSEDKQPPSSARSAFEEYRYDALGRRVLVRTRQDYACTMNCLNAIKRVVWDGDQILHEISAPGWTGAGPLMQRDTGLVVPATYVNTTHDARRIEFPKQAYRGFFYGRVMYTHGGGIDAPLSLTRMEYSDTLFGGSTIVPHADWRGSYDHGTGIPCRQILVQKRLKSQHTEPGLPDTVPTQYDNHCYEIQWPAPHVLVTRQRQDKDYLGEMSWMGSLLNEQRDASGQMYRRNRYYDPQSGRFTQEDPIGIAGGLNVYGYANGDPVSYSDPYGLCPGCGRATQGGGRVDLSAKPSFKEQMMELGEALRGTSVRNTIAEHNQGIAAAAQAHGVDAGLIKAIIYEEQTHQTPFEGFLEARGMGSTVGLGQVTVGKHGYSREQLLDPATNIQAIATHLGSLQEKGLIDSSRPTASLATNYNCGSCTSISGYGERVEKYRQQLFSSP